MKELEKLKQLHEETSGAYFHINYCKRMGMWVVRVNLKSFYNTSLQKAAGNAIKHVLSERKKIRGKVSYTLYDYPTL